MIKRKVRTNEKDEDEYEIEEKRYNPWSTLFIIIDVSLWITITILS